MEQRYLVKWDGTTSYRIFHKDDETSFVKSSEFQKTISYGQPCHTDMDSLDWQNYKEQISKIRAMGFLC